MKWIYDVHPSVRWNKLFINCTYNNNNNNLILKQNFISCVYKQTFLTVNHNKIIKKSTH